MIICCSYRYLSFFLLYTRSRSQLLLILNIYNTIFSINFENTSIGRKYRNWRRNPTIPTQLWNCYDLIENNMPRSNYLKAGWHN